MTYIIYYDINYPNKTKLVKKQTLLLTAFVAMCMMFASCNKSEKLDVVNGIVPVDVHDIQWRADFIKSLKPLTPAQRKAEIDKVVPRLNTQLVAMLRNHGKNCEITSITYVFGSGSARQVASGDGNTYDGEFSDQLYAVVKGGTCFGDSLMAFVQCFNGVFIIEGENQEIIGTYEPEFTIAKGQGINRYVDYRTSIWLAEHFDLKLYHGKGWNKKNEISAKEARELENTLYKTQVTVRVFPGDHFNLGTMEYTPAARAQ